MQLGVDPQIAQRIEPTQINAGAFKRGAVFEFGEHERKTHRTNLRVMGIRHDVLAVERDGGRDELGRHGFPEGE